MILNIPDNEKEDLAFWGTLYLTYYQPYMIETYLAEADTDKLDRYLLEATLIGHVVYCINTGKEIEVTAEEVITLASAIEDTVFYCIRADVNISNTEWLLNLMSAYRKLLQSLLKEKEAN